MYSSSLTATVIRNKAIPKSISGKKADTTLLTGVYLYLLQKIGAHAREVKSLHNSWSVVSCQEDGWKCQAKLLQASPPQEKWRLTNPDNFIYDACCSTFLLSFASVKKSHNKNSKQEKTKKALLDMTRHLAI